MISVIVPFKNEKESLRTLYADLLEALKNSGEFEVVFVDDGSEDEGGLVAQKMAEADPRVKFFRNMTSFGKGSALACGIKESKGEVLVFIDADLQDRPAEITRFIATLNSGYDLVNGHRVNRVSNKSALLYSKIFNWFLRVFLGSPFHDENCGFKAFRRSVLEKVTFYPDDFRMFPLAVYRGGFKVTEIEIVHRPRVFGKSKFGPFKFLNGIRDVFLFITRYGFWKKK